MPLHLRYTPYDLSANNLEKFCDQYDRYIIAHERYKKDGITPTELHFHIYIDTTLDIDSVRTAFKKALGIPTGGMGRNNKYYSLEQWRKECQCYVVKQKDIRASKGIAAENLRVHPCCPQWSQDTLRVPPYPEGEKEIKNTVQAATPPAKEKNNMWKEIFEEGIFWEKNHKNKKIEIEEALGIITKIVVKKLLPLPHPGDRKRWAQSLVMYSKLNLLRGETPENLEEVVMENTAIFMADHFCTNKSA